VELESRNGTESAAELLNTSELLTANDAALQAPIKGDIPLPECDGVRTQVQGLPELRLLWGNRQVMLHWALAGCCAAILLAFVIPKQYVSSAKLMAPEAQSVSSSGGFGSIAGGLLGVSSTGALLVAMMRSETIEDRMIDKFNLKQAYRVGLLQDARTRLEVKTSFRMEPKDGFVVLNVTDSDPQRAAAMARAYVEELGVIMAQLNKSPAHRERVFLQDRLQIVKVEMEAAEREFSEFASKSGAMDITEQGQVMIESAVKPQGKLIAEESQLEEVRQIYSVNGWTGTFFSGQA
jgi:uncharacterized protein involved in exopolysaccharide biosynthesis